MKEAQKHQLDALAETLVTPHRFMTPVVHEVMKPLVELQSLPDCAFLAERRAQYKLGDDIDDIVA